MEQAEQDEVQERRRIRGKKPIAQGMEKDCSN